ncbi:MAG TPA: DUF5671 domain-containing protein [Acidimicrobiia bacterium]|nr:DUF5671 domain-containing protein [Acidimicrobiia bacterium]
MTAVLSVVLLLLVVGGLIALGAKLLRNRGEQEESGGLDLIPYLLLALAVGVAGFSFAGLARASLTPGRFAGQPTGQIATALAGLVVAAPVALFLWRRQARRRKAHPDNPGWPIYLGVIELVFLTTFFISAAQFADAFTSTAITAEWPNLVVYGGIVAFHWWAERRELPNGQVGEVPRLVGSGVSVVALTVGAIGTLSWLFSEAYLGLGGSITVSDPAIPLALILVAGPIWALRWLPAWNAEANVLRDLYVSSVTALSLIVTVAAAVSTTAVLLTYLAGPAQSASSHFAGYPTSLAFLAAGGALWRHHRRRLGPGRTGALRGYQYAMAAAGLGALIGSAVALINAVFEPRLAGRSSGESLITLGTLALASGWVWNWFWRRAQTAPRDEEIRALQRRVYLIGMTVITGLTAAGALIAVLVVVFRAVLGDVDGVTSSLRLPLSLTSVSGAAAWHLLTQIRADNDGRERMELKPFTVTVICSHPGSLATLFPREANVRILYRADASAIVDDETAATIVADVDNQSSLVWVDESGYRIARARES